MPLYSQGRNELDDDLLSFGVNQPNPAIDFPVDEQYPDELTDFVAAEEAGGVEPPAGIEELPDFYEENLAEHIDKKTLDTLAGEIVEGIEADKRSRQKWENSLSTIIKYLGWEIEDYEDKLCKGYDNTLSTTLMNFFALIKSELLPPSGPAKGVVDGIPTEEAIEVAERLAIFFNVFLTTKDRIYYPDKERLILYVGLFGLAFTKVYQDPILKRPTSRLVKPQDLIVNHECVSLLESSRITHRMELTKKDVLLRERDGLFLRGTLKNSDDSNSEDSQINTTIRDIEGITKDAEENKYSFDYYESHVELSPSMLRDRIGSSKPDEDDDDIDNIPRPYIVTICESTGKIASIKRNWNEFDNKFNRIECFVEWHYLPGLGLYGNGLCQLVGSNAIVLTNTLRQTLDGITFGNFPGGFVRKGSLPENNNITVYPGQFIPIDTDDRPITDIYSTLPFSGPSPIAVQIRAELKADTAMLGGAAQQASPMSNSEAPVGTTLANIEIRDRFPSNILQSFITSQTYEFKLYHDLFKNYFGDETYSFDVPGNHYEVTKEDFHKNVKILPIADPNLSTKSQRIVINELLIRIARENPGTIDLKEAVRRLIKSMGVEDIDKLMPPPEEIVPLDPISENINFINGKGARASMEQDHDSHIMVHSILPQNPSVAQDPMKMAAIQAHISEHQAFKYLVQIQMAMGTQMPDPQALRDPQAQNQIAMMAAEATQKLQVEQQAQNPPPPNPAVVVMEEIKQKREASLLKHEEAKLRAETEAFKVQTQFESSQNKMDVEKELSKEKNKVSLAIEKMKQHNLE